MDCAFIPHLYFSAYKLFYKKCFQPGQGKFFRLLLVSDVRIKGTFKIFMGRIDAEAETPVLWPPDAKSQLIGKDPYAGKD